MRITLPLATLLAAFILGCGYHPHPKNGKLSCREGCPSGYVCGPDNFCWIGHPPDSSADTSSLDVPWDTAVADTSAADDGNAGSDDSSTDVPNDRVKVDEDAADVRKNPGDTTAINLPDTAQDTPRDSNKAPGDTGGTDTALADGGVTDAGPDAPADSFNPSDGNDQDAGLPHLLCGPPSAKVFRDSFDQSVLVTGAGWSASTAGGASFSLDTSDSVSSPGSAMATFPSVSDSTSSSASLRTPYVTDGHLPTIYVSFDIKISSTCLSKMYSGRSAFIAGIQPSSQYSLYISVANTNPPTLCVEEFKGVGTSIPSAGHQPVTLDEWQHVELEVRFSGDARGFLQVGSGPAQYFTSHPSGGALAGDEWQSLFIGPYLSGQHEACTVHYDNVVFDSPAACAQ